MNPITDIKGSIEALFIEENGKSANLIVNEGDISHNILVEGKTNIGKIFYEANPTKYISGLKFLWGLPPADQESEIASICNPNRQIVFRTYNQDNKTMLFACMSTKYKKTTIETILPSIYNALPKGTEITILPSTDRHGGKADITITKDNIGVYTLSVDAGTLNGNSSLHLRGSGMILFCTNQLSFELSKEFEDIPTIDINSRVVHMDRGLEAFEVKLIEAIDSIKEFSGVIESAKSIFLSPTVTSKILDHYISKNKISNKIKTLIIETLLDRNIQQVPDTLWGLAMTTTYLGTHTPSLRLGVKRSLQSIGGELLIVATNFLAFKAIIDPTPVPEIESSFPLEPLTTPVSP